MILSPHFVWVHVPKTGGTWIRETLRNNAPPSWGLQIRYPGHHSIRSVGPAHAKLRAFAFVRNPWDWYVSWYSFWRMHLDRRSGSFSAPEERWTEKDKLRALIVRKPFPAAVDLAQEHGVGLGQQFRFLCVRDDGSIVECLRFERLRADLLVMLARVGCYPTQPIRSAVSSSPPAMTSEHRPWPLLYDRVTADAVREHEREIIDRFGYRFEPSSS